MNEVFEAFRNCISDRKCENKDCPYEGKCQIANGRDQYIQIPKHLALDVLNILKEQEAKTGTWQWKIHGRAESGGTLGEAICDQCGKSTYATAVKGDLNYCPNCGARMEE